MLATLLPLAALAAEVRVHGRLDPIAPLAAGTAFDLHVARADLAVDYDDGSAGDELRIGRLGLSLHEILAPGTRAGIRLGWIAFTQSGRAATAGLDPSGYYAELAFRGAWPHGAMVGAHVGAAWRYSSVDATDADGEPLEMDWQAFELRPALRIRAAPGVALRLGATAIAVDGDERHRARTTPFTADGNAGAFAALDLSWADGDAVTLRARGGNPVGVYIGFEQRY